MSNIYLDYRRAVQQAEELRDIGQELKRMSDGDFADTLSRLSSVWESDSAALYLQKGHKLRDDISKTAAKLDSIAGTIEQIAKRILEAEEAAQTIASERTY